MRSNAFARVKNRINRTAPRPRYLLQYPLALPLRRRSFLSPKTHLTNGTELRPFLYPHCTTHSVYVCVPHIIYVYCNGNAHIRTTTTGRRLIYLVCPRRIKTVRRAGRTAAVVVSPNGIINFHGEISPFYIYIYTVICVYRRRDFVV